MSNMSNRRPRLFVCTVLAVISFSNACTIHSRHYQSDGRPFCCFWTQGESNNCRTCHDKAEKTSWCATTADNCKHCGGSWCADGLRKYRQSAATQPFSPIHSDQSQQQLIVPDDDDDDHSDRDDFNEDRDDAVSPRSNPFESNALYVNPTFKHNIMKTIKTVVPGATKNNLVKMSTVASAYWLDVKGKVQPEDDKSTNTAAGILKDAASMSAPPLVTFIVYNLPNRDCMAKASNGEVCCGAKMPEGNCDYLDAASTGTCSDGMGEYKHQYIDKLAVSVKKYCNKVPMVLVIEPDSLANLITNTDEPKCGSSATKAAYRNGIKYAIRTLASACPKATLYLDGAHGGWLGWPDNLKKFVEEVKGMGIANYLRGFSLNVANYQPLGVLCPSVGFCIAGKNKEHACCDDPCGLSMDYNPGHSELNYAAALSDAMRQGIPGFSPKFVIDTGRNARSPRSKCSNWCNARGAGAGIRPTTQTAAPGLVDAYHWLKTPGESDGCTSVLPDGGKCARFDADCASVDSIGSREGEPRCPEAGGWFDFQIKMLAKNAIM